MTAACSCTVPSRPGSLNAHSIGYEQSRDQDIVKRSPAQVDHSMTGYLRGQDLRSLRALILRSIRVHRQTAIASRTGGDV
jgi:hypothetical protein